MCMMNRQDVLVIVNDNLLIRDCIPSLLMKIYKSFYYFSVSEYKQNIISQELKY